MDEKLIINKFGGKYNVDEATYVMGIHQALGDKISKRFRGSDLVLDACLGAGLMTIALAKYVNKVIGVDINERHLEFAKENAAIAGLGSKIVFLLGDVTSEEILNKIGKIDAAFLDPDWAVGDNKRLHVTTLGEMHPPGDMLLEKIFQKTPNIALRLPKEFRLDELRKLPPHEIEEEWLENKLKFYVAYFGKLKVGI